MKNFLTFISETVVVPDRENTLDIDRKDMPQISSNNMKHFLSYLDKKSIRHKEQTIDPNALKATQGHFHKEKIRNIISSMEDGSYKVKPILISKDNYIMDGHHRWLAHSNLNTQLPVHRINLPVKSLIGIIHDYPKSFTEKLYS